MMHNLFSLSSRDVRWCVIVFVAMRLFLTLWAGVVFHVSPLEVDWRTSSVIPCEQVVPTGGGAGRAVWDALLSPWHRWDTEWYLKIAMQGYGPPSDGRVAFAPLYPFLIRALGGLLHGHYLLAALVLSSLTAFLSCLLLYQQSLHLFGQSIARRSVLYLLSFPTAFFLVAGYTESVFLVVALLAWRAAENESWIWAGVFGALATLTRFPGVTLLVPLTYIWWRADARDLNGLGLLAIPGAFLAWAFYARFGPAGQFPWSPQMQVWDHSIGWPWDGAVNNALTLLGLRKGSASFPQFHLLLDLLAVVLIVLSSAAAFRVLPKGYVVLMASLLVPTLTVLTDGGLLMSVSRYILPVFPMFITLGRAGSKSWFHRIWLCLSLLLQAFASAGFFLGLWVA